MKLMHVYDLLIQENILFNITWVSLIFNLAYLIFNFSFLKFTKKGIIFILVGIKRRTFMKTKKNIIDNVNRLLNKDVTE